MIAKTLFRYTINHRFITVAQNLAAAVKQFHSQYPLQRVDNVLVELN